jgi:NAD-dependent dihydropyrimidine dehydrogenase PreA subunit
MIEIVSNSRCTECNICVQICPMNVFDAHDGKPPTVARKADCQTCYMCELYCPADALYVAPDADRSTLVKERALEAAETFGGYRRAGWARQEETGELLDQSFRLDTPH